MGIVTDLTGLRLHPMPDPWRGSIECERCGAVVVMVPDLRIVTILVAAQSHECPTPHEEPPPPWRDMTRGDSDE